MKRNNCESQSINDVTAHVNAETEDSHSVLRINPSKMLECGEERIKECMEKLTNTLEEKLSYKMEQMFSDMESRILRKMRTFPQDYDKMTTKKRKLEEYEECREISNVTSPDRGKHAFQERSSLEGRIEAVEKTINKLLDVIAPRMESLVTQMEGCCPPSISETTFSHDTHPSENTLSTDSSPLETGISIPIESTVFPDSQRSPVGNVSLLISSPSPGMLENTELHSPEQQNVILRSPKRSIPDSLNNNPLPSISPTHASTFDRNKRTQEFPEDVCRDANEDVQELMENCQKETSGSNTSATKIKTCVASFLNSSSSSINDKDKIRSIQILIPDLSFTDYPKNNSYDNANRSFSSLPFICPSKRFTRTLSSDNDLEIIRENLRRNERKKLEVTLNHISHNITQKCKPSSFEHLPFLSPSNINSRSLDKSSTFPTYSTRNIKSKDVNVVGVKTKKKIDSVNKTPHAHVTSTTSYGRFNDQSEELILAASDGRTEEVRRLLLGESGVEARDPEGCTALHWAARRGRVDALALLLAAGAECTARDRIGWTPLHCAAAYDHAGHCVARLLSAGAPVDATSNAGLTPLHLAALYSNAAATAALLAAGASKSARDAHGRLPLAMARSQPVLRLLRS